MRGCSNHAFFLLVEVPWVRRSFLPLCFLIRRRWLMMAPASKTCWEHEIVFCMEGAKAWYCYIEVSKSGVCGYNNRGCWEKRCWDQAMLDSDQALDQRLFSEEETHRGLKVTVRPKGQNLGDVSWKPGNARLEVWNEFFQKEELLVIFHLWLCEPWQDAFGCFRPPRKPTLSTWWPWHYHWLQSLSSLCRQSWLPPLWCPLVPSTASVPVWHSSLEMALALAVECLKDWHQPGHLGICSAQSRSGIDIMLNKDGRRVCLQVPVGTGFLDTLQAS